MCNHATVKQYVISLIELTVNLLKKYNKTYRKYHATMDFFIAHKYLYSQIDRCIYGLSCSTRTVAL